MSNISGIRRPMLSATLGALAAAAACAAGPAAAGTLDTVKSRGNLICGVSDGRAGFSSVDSQGNWTGIDVDSCRAVAAAVLSDATKVTFVPLTVPNRFAALQSGQVDVLARTVTWTLTRDAAAGLDVTAVTFYDAQGFLVPKSLGAKSAKDLDGATVCMLPGSTSEKAIAAYFQQHKMAYKPVVLQGQKELYTAFFSGRCDVYMQSTSGLSSARANFAKNPDDYVILPERLGKDPMGPAVRHGDHQWKDLVTWTMFALFEAEELGITSKNVDEKLKSDDPDVQRLLGVTPGVGQPLGLDDRWAYRVVKQVGNYAEVYDRSAGAASALKLDRGMNALWRDGGLIFSPSFQ
ncbi:MAG: amino acid ABC transporter substrate-binding protein [Alphaproteobacteria bacterium]